MGSLRLHVVEEVGVETLADLFQQLWRELEIDLSGAQVHMAHVGGQRGEASVELLAVAVPVQEPMHREGVAEVMEPGAMAFAVGDAHAVEQSAPGLVGRGVAQAPAGGVDQKGIAWRTPPVPSPSLQVDVESPIRRGVEG